MQRKTRKSAVILSWMLGFMILLSVLSIPASNVKAETASEQQYRTDFYAVQTAANANTSLATPKISSVSNAATGVKISWGKVSGAAKYRVYYKTGSGSWTKIADTTSTSYTWTGAKSGTKYSFTVRCLSSNGKSFTSGYDATGKSILYLAQPTVSVANASTGVTVSWGKITGASGYYVYRKTSSSSSWTRIATIKSGNTLSYTDTKATAGSAYIYTVKAYSGSTNSMHNTTGKTITYLAQPTVSVANVSTGVKISWSKSAGASGYYVYRKVSGGSWTKIATISKGSTVSYTDTTPSGGTTYIYTVKSYSGSYTSSYNTSGKSIKYLKQPTVSVANVSTGVQVSWNKITGASGYYVYRKTSSSGSWTRIATVSSGSTVSYTDTKAASGSTYIYTVKAYSGSTNSMHNTTGQTIKYLAQPTVSVANASTGVKVSWSKSTGATGYYVYRKTSGSSWSRIATVSNVNTLTYTDKTAVVGSTYIYTVKSYSGSYVSSYNKSGKSIKHDNNVPAYYTINLGNGKTTKVYGYYDTAMADEIISQLNAYRKSKGLSTLTKTTALTAAANTRAYEISYLMDHTRPNGTDCFTASASGQMYGENIAAGYPSASAVMAAWKGSPGHNANMLSDYYQTIGVSVFIALSGDHEGYRIYLVQNFGF